MASTPKSPRPSEAVRLENASMKTLLSVGGDNPPYIAIPTDSDSLAALRERVGFALEPDARYDNGSFGRDIDAQIDAVLAEILGDVEKESGDA